MELQISQLLRYAWATYKENWKTWLGLIFILLAINVVGSALGYEPANEYAQASGSIAADIIVALVSLIAGVMIIMTALKQVRKEKASILSSLEGLSWKEFLRYVLVAIVSSIVILIGLIALVIPGIIISLMWSLAPYLVLDQKSGIIESLKRSYHITRGHKWDILALVMIVLIINLLGLLALVVGLFVTIPVSYLAFARMYDLLLTQAKEEK